MSSLVFLVPNRLENSHDCRNSGLGVGLREQLTADNASIMQFLENVHDVFVADFACARLMTPRCISNMNVTDGIYALLLYSNTIYVPVQSRNVMAGFFCSEKAEPYTGQLFRAYAEPPQNGR